MSGTLPGLETPPEPVALPPAGSPERFTRRWRLIGAGLSNVWRFGDLELPALSGRLLLRGPNGTGKTTAIEVLWPFLLDLNSTRLAAGRARSTSLSSLMREGATGKRRIGYAWMTFSGPGEGTVSFGARIEFSEGASPPTRVVPFSTPGRPLHELPIHGPARSPLTAEQFATATKDAGGQVFEDHESYLAHLAVRLFGTSDTREIDVLAQRIRHVRNPSNLADVSPQQAVEALRESLPTVAEDVVLATAEALAESDETRLAFTRDKDAADLLESFRDLWCGHAVGVARSLHATALEASRDLKAVEDDIRRQTEKQKGEREIALKTSERVRALEEELAESSAEIEAIQGNQAYKDAGRLNDLRATARAHAEQADAVCTTMVEVATSAGNESRSVARELSRLLEDYLEFLGEIAGTDGSAVPGAEPFGWTAEERAVLSAGAVSAHPGLRLQLRGGSEEVTRLAVGWRTRGEEYRIQADGAELALADYVPVEMMAKELKAALEAEAEAAARADREAARSRKAEIEASDAARDSLRHVATWTSANLALGTQVDDGDEWETWTSDAVRALETSESAQVLSLTDAWAHGALARAESAAAGLRAEADVARATARTHEDEASRVRAQAEGLRHGKLLPFPRPGWMPGVGDDTNALGSALDWADGFDDASARALLEGALSAAGLLGATLESDAIITPYWRAEAAGPRVEPNLSGALSVDRAHPMAAIVEEILVRVLLVPTAAGTAIPGLVFGHDGTFRAGVLSGAVATPDVSAQSVASHVGSRQRREAALSRAEALEREAADLDRDAKYSSERAASASREGDAIAAAGRSFPSRDLLRGRESARSSAAERWREVRSEADAASQDVSRRRVQFEEARSAWAERTRVRGLPSDPEHLAILRSRSESCAQVFMRVAGRLTSTLAPRLAAVTGSYDEVRLSRKLNEAELAAQGAVQEAARTRTQVRVLEETAGSAIEEIVRRHEVASLRKKEGERELGPARTRKDEAAADVLRSGVTIAAESRRLDDEVRPRAAECIRSLRSFLEIPGIQDAALDGVRPAGDDQLLSQVAGKLVGRKVAAMRSVRERADELRAKVAGLWSVDPGEDHGELLTYVLTHRDATYTPTQAAFHAAALREQAAKALEASEEKALRDFVVGRLPGAISAAWTRLHDWVDEVNRKMRSADASSGVGVQVRTPTRDDLSPHARTVFQLCCKTSDAERTSQQENDLSAALQALLHAADGETMQQRVGAAVDVRAWVDVFYEVQRPDKSPQRWHSRTGLSGGERRLVVLAPMLAAVAAAYEKYGPKALRLAALDEVPAEVDERGREGLARYLAELDLDLVCTSYLWDGSPGAWDGIDAHDLEAGPDGTVVAFPMLIRGLTPIPGES